MKKSQSRELSSVPVLCSSSEGWNLVEPEVHLLREALTISFHISSFVFGRWETLFGFWVSHSKSAMQCRVPKFDVIGVRGAPLPMPECLGVPMIQSKATRVSRILGERESDCSIEEAWRSYLMDIPFDVRESVANINGNQWVALEAIWDQPEFLVAFSNRIARNFIRAIFLLADVNNCTHSERRKIYWKLAHQPKVEVLKAYEPDCCRQTVRLLEKFDFDWDNDAGSLVQFLTIIASSETRIILRHCNQITLDMAEIANDPTIPRSWKSPKTISWMAECVDAKILIEMLAAVLMRDASVKEAARILSRVSDRLRNLPPHELRAQFLEKIRTGHAAHLFFPRPPVEYKAPLRPLSSLKDIQEEGEVMGHCLLCQASFYASEIIAGNLFLFAWEGTERATVSIRRLGWSWRIDEISGKLGTSCPDLDQVATALVGMNQPSALNKKEEEGCA